ncbi:dihydrofolate reductase family protein [Cohnella nanjingensis]|uniref:Dihydrofolate reductase family protein n=1 Tax=Cohnella nanjingensis TaxID=1387779 RepID=A0A7X0RMP3_9BACL|nr:dihydrofolate reductase family protein [Cohnella nanjingensis]MBB6670362.1 dihydrofolate reductase family protein [Cohnella nanjingensis]
MRKVIVSEFVSLDGVMEEPGWTFQFGGEEQDKFKFEELKASDALLLGRVTYEGFAAAWPNMIEQTGEYGEWMNGYPKHVVSTTLDRAEWTNSSVIKGDIAEEITKLKEQPGKDILVFGSCALVQTLHNLGLIDEYRLMVYPIVVGSGKRLFQDGLNQTVLKLTETKTFQTGVVVLTYQKA